MMESRKPEQNPYAYLDEMSTEALKELLDAKIANNVEDEELYYLLEVVDRREFEDPAERRADIDRAWADFQKYYHTPEGEGRSLFADIDTVPDAPVMEELTSKSKEHHYSFHRILIAAAVAACSMALLISSAFGFNPFKVMGQWTRDIFSFTDTQEVSSHNENNPKVGVNTQDDVIYNTLQDALDAYEITAVFAPTWIPDGFKCVDVCITEFATSTDFYAFYEEKGRTLSITITKHNSKNVARSYEKDMEIVTSFPVDGAICYIFENNGQLVAAWHDGTYECFINGDIPEDEMEKVVKSIFKE